MVLSVDKRPSCVVQVPYLKRVAIAHKLHHSEKFDGVPWGLFLGPMVRCLLAKPTPLSCVRDTRAAS